MLAALWIWIASDLPETRPDALTARDPAVFAPIDRAVDALPLPSPRTLASVAKGLARVAVSPLDRARAAYRWTSERVEYRLDRPRTAEQALSDLAGDCESHARLFDRLCQEMGVPSRRIGGDARFANPPGPALRMASKPLGPGQWRVLHAWNAVCIGGKWGLVDTTYASGKGTQDDYFLVDPATLATDHWPNETADWLLQKTPSIDALKVLPIVRPAAWRRGVGLADFAVPPVSEAGRTVFRPRLPWNARLRSVLQVDNRPVSDRTMLQPEDGSVALWAACEQEGGLAWLGEMVGDRWCPFVGYPLGTAVSNEGFPRILADLMESGGVLLRPLTAGLRVGQPVEIALRVPGASAVVAFAGDAVMARCSREGDLWRGSLTPAKGEVEIMASFDDPRRFRGLVRYSTRP